MSRYTPRTSRPTPEPTDTFTAIPDWIGVRRELSCTTKCVFGKIRRYSLYYERAFPSQNRIARELGLHRKTVGEALRALVDLGLIERRRTNRGYEYRLPEAPHPWELEYRPFRVFAKGEPVWD